MSEAAAESAITACGIPAVSSSHAVRRAPCSSGRVSSTQTCASRSRSQAASSAPDGAAVAAGGETAGVAVRERARPGREQRRRMRGHRAAALDLVAVDRTRMLRRRIVAHLVERPAEVHGSRARLAQNAFGRG